MAGGFARHFFNCKNSGTLEWRWLFPALAVAMILSLPKTSFGNDDAVTLSDIRPLITQHCVGCHSANPTDVVFRAPPLGLVLDTDAEILAATVYKRIVIDRSMPFNNQTKMTDAERQQIAAWWGAMKESEPLNFCRQCRQFCGEVCHNKRNTIHKEIFYVNTNPRTTG